MNEDEWQECTDPTKMLEFLRMSGRPSNRKLRLFACACCGNAAHLLTHESLREAVETAERYADGQAQYNEMVQVTKAVDQFANTACETDNVVCSGIWHLTTMGLWWNLRPTRRTERTVRALLQAEGGLRFRQAPLLRCIFNPFIPVSNAPPAWNSGIVLRLAQAIYEERTFDRLPILADALEEAGGDAALLAHLRRPGPHVRGCHVIDLLLRKE